MDKESKFLQELLSLHHGVDTTKKLKILSQDITWAQGWPTNTTAFWNAEAFMWQAKIAQHIRATIKEELKGLTGRNCDLGAGAYSYIPSVCVDISPKMLKNNEHCQERVIANLEEPLPLAPATFDSVTAIFLLNYIRNLTQLLKEIQRILKKKGIFLVVLSVNPLNPIHEQHVVNRYTKEKWLDLLNTYFDARVTEKQGLYFFTCTRKLLKG